ncbi:MAG TPA: D-alanyl-D-alanine carboxypeptidase family protein [Rhodospirillales bacterium]|jgi:D-alanyl-D-alanine carboxypeptidase
MAVAVVAALGAAHPAEAKYASLVMDADSGRVFHEINADTRNYPASLTKMMTLYLVFEALKTELWKMDTPLRVSARAAQQPSSRLGLSRGDRIRVKDAIMALVTKSANDVATVVAENMSGSETAFALKMTARARELGMSQTTFRNASGLPHRAQMSTARDMGVLARALIRDFPEYYRFFATTEFRYDGVTHTNHNKLLNTYEGVDGIKTGYINASGFNLVASARRDGHRVIAVIFGGNSPNSRNALMTRLLNLGFKAVENGPVVASAAADNPKPARAQAAPPPPEPPQAVAARDAPRSDAASPPRNLRWGVQVGVFSRHVQALEAARQAIETAPEQLSLGALKVAPLKNKNGKVLHHARIEGITKQQAYDACKSLKRRKMGCLEMKLPDSYRVAANDF